MSNCKLQWATPDIDKQIMYMARVSNPAGQNSESTRLLYYCMEHRTVAEQILAILRTVAPITMDAFFPEEKTDARA